MSDVEQGRTWDWDGDGEAQWFISPEGKRVWVDEATVILNSCTRKLATAIEALRRIVNQPARELTSPYDIARTALSSLDTQEDQG